MLESRVRDERSGARGLVARVLRADAIEHIPELFQAHLEILRRDAGDTLLGELGVQAIHDVVYEIALLHIAEPRIKRLRADS